MIRYRRAQPDDIATCVQFIADHPVVGPRYGPAIEHLGTRVAPFSRLRWVFLASSSEETGPGTAARMIGSYTAGIISDEFAMELATPPLKWIGPEVVKRCVQSPVPIMTDAAVQRANSTEGVNILVWPTAARADFEILPEADTRWPGSFSSKSTADTTSSGFRRRRPIQRKWWSP